MANNKQKIDQKLKELVNAIMDYQGLSIKEDMDDVYMLDDKTHRAMVVEIDENIMTLRINIHKAIEQE